MQIIISLAPPKATTNISATNTQRPLCLVTSLKTRRQPHKKSKSHSRKHKSRQKHKRKHKHRHQQLEDKELEVRNRGKSLRISSRSRSRKEKQSNQFGTNKNESSSSLQQVIYKHTKKAADIQTDGRTESRRERRKHKSNRKHKRSKNHGGKLDESSGDQKCDNQTEGRTDRRAGCMGSEIRDYVTRRKDDDVTSTTESEDGPIATTLIQMNLQDIGPGESITDIDTFVQLSGGAKSGSKFRLDNKVCD
jgi:hypothetical protein